jgi:hypothetical protein
MSQHEPTWPILGLAGVKDFNQNSFSSNLTQSTSSAIYSVIYYSKDQISLYIRQDGTAWAQRCML